MLHHWEMAGVHWYKGAWGQLWPPGVQPVFLIYNIVNSGNLLNISIKYVPPKRSLMEIEKFGKKLPDHRLKYSVSEEETFKVGRTTRSVHLFPQHCVNICETYQLRTVLRSLTTIPSIRPLCNYQRDRIGQNPTRSSKVQFDLLPPFLNALLSNRAILWSHQSAVYKLRV